MIVGPYLPAVAHPGIVFLLVGLNIMANTIVTLPAMVKLVLDYGILCGPAWGSQDTRGDLCTGNVSV